MKKFALQNIITMQLFEICNSLGELNSRTTKRFECTKRGNEAYYRTAWYKNKGGKKTEYTLDDFMKNKQRVRLVIIPIGEDGGVI